LIDPRAIVSPDAEIAEGVAIGPFAVIGPGVRIGAGTWIGPHAVVNGPTTLGRDNKVFQFASIGDAPQDRKYAGEPTQLIVGDRNVFREFCSINRGTAGGRAQTTIANDCLFMAYSHVAHDCIVGSHCIMSIALPWRAMATRRLGNSLGYAGIHQFCRVGSHAFLANNAATRRAAFVWSRVRPPSRKASTAGLKRRVSADAPRSRTSRAPTGSSTGRS
jgi:UDP-N-acetylglucosamine acyltransferase